MKTNDLLSAAVLGLILLIVWPFFIFSKGDAAQVSSAIATSVGVLAALFQEDLKRLFHPPDVKVELVRAEGLWEPTFGGGDYVYHLKISNLTPGEKPLRKCIVVLIGIEKRGGSEERCLVERTFRWAPAEGRESAIDIWSYRLLDFGRLDNPEKPVPDQPGRFLEKPDRFELSFVNFFNQESGRYEPQGGHIESWVAPQETARFRFEVRCEHFSKSYIAAVSWNGHRPLPQARSEMAAHLRIEISPEGAGITASV